MLLDDTIEQRPSQQPGLRRDARQDKLPVDKRKRVQEWAARIEWMKENKPRRSVDWPPSSWRTRG